MSFRETKVQLDPDNHDLVFQISSWFAEDYDYGDDEDSAGDKYLVKVFGVTEEGKSVSVNLLNYTPFFYIKSPYPVGRSTVQNIREFLVARLPWKLKESLLDISVVKKKDFWGFTNNEKFNFIRLKFNNLAAFRSASRIFSKRVDISGISRNPIKFKLYESNIEPFLRMMHIRDIEPTGWVEIKKGNYEANSHIIPTHCQIDVSCEWSAISKTLKEKIAPLVVASFDLECTSSHGDFPVPKKTYKKTAYELTQYFADLKIKEKKDLQDIKKILFDELLKIFNHDDIDGTLSKVFTKNKVDISVLELKLKRAMDDIIAILSGKLGYKKEGEINTSTKDAILKALTKKIGDYEVNEQQESWVGLFPPLEGDPIIQIGTTVHLYGEKQCCSRFILTLGTCDPIEDVVVIACDTEKELMLKWRDLMLKIDPDVVTGYNIFGFDMSYLHDRAKELGILNDFMKIGRFMDHRSKYVEKELSSSALGDNLLKYIDMEGRVLIDVMKVVQRDHKLDSYKLDAVANHFMKMNKHDVHPSDIFRLQKGSSEDRKVIASYCVQDCALCNHLIMKLEILANNIGMSNVCNVPLSYIFMRGQGIKIFSLVAKECRVYDFLIPTLNNYIKDEDDEENPDDDGYEGAIVLEPKEGIYIDDPITVLDYASLYPSSMISENLSHDSIILDPKYDNLEGYEYLDIVYDIYEKVDDKKVKKGEKTVRFAQFPDGEKGTIPKILMKLLKQRKETRKKIEFQTVTTKTNNDESNNTYKGLIKEKDDKVIVTSIDGKSTEISREDIESITDTYDDFQKAVLDGLQLAYKVTANSLYGQCGARTSSIYMKEIAACTTATGRKMIYMVKEFAEKNYNAEVVYGDSVTSYTPILIKHDMLVKIETIEKIGTKYGNDIWKKCIENGKQDKESCEIHNVEVWTDSGWTKIHRVIRHALSDQKKIVRVNTHSAIVDVTDDHSLLNLNKEEVSPNNLKIGDSLLHSSYPLIETQCNIHSINEARIMGFFCGDGSCGDYICPSGRKRSWALNNSDLDIQEKYKRLCEEVYPELEWVILDTLASSGVYKLVPQGDVKSIVKKYRELMYYDKEKIVPVTILNASFEIRESFWKGLYDADGDKEDIITRIDQKNQISNAMFNLLGDSLGYKTSLNSRIDKLNIFRLNLTKNSQRKDPNKIKKMYEIPYNGYVYDLTTDNHHFQAGIGKLIVHNTDSCFLKFPIKDALGNTIKGKEAIMPSIQVAKELSAKFKPYLKPPHDAEYEKTFYPFILFSKKRYCANKYEHDDKHCKMASMGIVLKRRDNAHIVKKIYGGILDIILNEQDIKKSLKFLKESLNELIDGKYPLEDLIITKSLRSDYKDPDKIAHKVLAERMGERDPGNKPQVNDRIPFVYVQVDEKKGKKMLQGERIEHPDYIRSKKLKPDYEFYITNQIMKPVLQLYALTLENLDGYRKASNHFEEIRKKLIKEKEGDMKKVKDRLNDLKEDEVKKLLFDPILIKLANKRNKNTVITDYFKFE